ncbi:DUF6616 family protein [Mycobacterium sp. NPDC049093]
MQQLFVDMYNYKQTWIELNAPQREACISKAVGVLAALQADGTVLQTVAASGQ